MRHYLKIIPCKDRLAFSTNHHVFIVLHSWQIEIKCSGTNQCKQELLFFLTPRDPYWGNFCFLYPNFWLCGSINPDSLREVPEDTVTAPLSPPCLLKGLEQQCYLKHVLPREIKEDCKYYNIFLVVEWSRYSIFYFFFLLWKRCSSMPQTDDTMNYQ